MMPNYTADEIIQQIDSHFEDLRFARALVTFLGPEDVGRQQYRPGSYYKYRPTITVPVPLTEAIIQDNNSAASWINQSFVIRLHALLDCRHVLRSKPLPKVIDGLDGCEDVKILDQLRNIFAHTTGRYNPRKSEHKKLMRRIIEQYHLDATVRRKDFPAQIDTILEPMTEGCKRYVRAFFSQKN